MKIQDHEIELREGVVIDLDSDLQRSTFKYIIDCGLREIAGPGNEAAYGQMLVWKELAQEGKT
jgi:hypothetical protein